MARRSDVYTRWALAMRRRGYFHPGNRVGVAVSGGPDSVLLLDFMKAFAAAAGLTLAVVHFNHHLRGPESDADEEYVRKLAETVGLEFLRGEAEVAVVAREQRRNLEATARELRYRFFFSLVSQGRLDKVATAHTANDQAETVLLRVLRGTGTRGLGGIYPVLEGKVVRPFLSLTRAEVLRELAARRLEYRVDSSNLDPRLRRNKVRRELLPLLEKEFNPEIIPLLKSLADRARDDEAFLEQQARARGYAWRVREGPEEKIPVRPLTEFPPAIARRVLRQMLEAVRGTLRGVTHGHIEALRCFASEAQSGRNLILPGGMIARKQFDWLALGPLPVSSADREFSYLVQVPSELTVPQLGLVFRFKIVRPEELPRAYNGVKVGGLDAQRLSGKLVLRNWRAGDCFWPVGFRKLCKLKELFRQRKIPRQQRQFWPVLECEKQIVWVHGFPPARDAAASTSSSTILLVEEEAASSP